MELTFRAAAPAERLYIARQSTQIEGQTGSVGHLQADMGEDGKGFFPNAGPATGKAWTPRTFSRSLRRFWRPWWGTSSTAGF
mgnify:CR=1 FL=1